MNDTMMNDTYVRRNVCKLNFIFIVLLLDIKLKMGNQEKHQRISKENISNDSNAILKQ